MFTVETKFPVAHESYDHLFPFGTIRDNNSNLNLIQKFKELGIKSVLDIGCAGGLFVEELIQNGINAVGIEGSDINLKIRRASWDSIPDNLFTADATKPFVIRYNDSPFKADVVTAWEFFEHIEARDLNSVMNNINQHSHPDTHLLCSISNFPSPHAGVDLHRTKENLEYWLSLFELRGFLPDETLERYYERNYVRYGTYNLVLRKLV